MSEDYLSLKWGSLKSWHLTGKKAQSLLKQYFDLGVSASALMHHDTPEQKALICQIIDECKADTIWLDWDDKEISKQDAKDYVLSYGK